MPDMFIWSLDKTKKERLANFEKDLVRKWKVNNLNSISFSVFRSDLNKRAFDLMEGKAQIEYDGTTYTIEELDRMPFGDTQMATVTAEHVFYDEFMNRTYVYTTLPTAKRSLNEYMSFIVAGTNFTFSIINSFETKEIENFGGGNPLELFKSLLEKFEAEFEIVGNDIRLYSRSGSQQGYPYRSKHNISDVATNESVKNLSTYIKGFGKEYEEKDMLTGETRNMTGFNPDAWFDKTEPYYGTTLGATFKMEYYGTGVRFNYYAAPDGGIIEFTLDNDPEKKATVSCWNSTGVVRSVDLFRDAEQKSHTIYGVFKGKDPDHEPTLNGLDAPRCYVLYRSGSGQKTYDIYKNREGDEKYMAIAEYTSPLAAKYGIRVQAPIFDERFTNSDYLTSYLRENLNDKLEISHEMTFVDLAKAGGPIPKPRIGNSVPYIVEELGIMIPDVRIMEIDEYPEDYKSSTVVLGNGRDDFGEAVFNSGKQQLDEIYDSRKGRMNPDVLPEATKRATDLINNSATDLEYPVGGGILGRDPKDYNRFTKFTSAGVGITTNGGVTYDNAITPDGINTLLLTAGQIKTNNIQIIGTENLFYWDGNELIAIDPNNQNKFVRLNSSGIYMARGSSTIERGDGFKLVDDGYANFSYATDMAMPPPISNGVYQEGRWYKNTNTEKGDVFYYSFEHVTQYLYLQLAFHAESGGAGYITVEGSGEFTGTTYASFYTNHSIGNEYANTGRVFVADLGVPTGGTRSVYVRIRSNVADKFVAVRHIRGYLRG